jgi:hypothetical protein
MSRYFRRDGTPYTGERAVFEWAHDFEDAAKCIVAQESLSDGKWVSTVWTGLPTNPNAERKLIFETAVFSAHPPDADIIDQDRYATELEALQGHNRLVGKWRRLIRTVEVDVIKMNEPETPTSKSTIALSDGSPRKGRDVL